MRGPIIFATANKIPALNLPRTYLASGTNKETSKNDDIYSSHHRKSPKASVKIAHVEKAGVVVSLFLAIGQTLPRTGSFGDILLRRHFAYLYKIF
jgi:hypothetical protein